MPVPRRFDDAGPCRPEHDRVGPSVRCIPAGRPCRIRRRRVSYVHRRKERASGVRARPRNGSVRRTRGGHRATVPEVSKLIHAPRGPASAARRRSLAAQARRTVREILPADAARSRARRQRDFATPSAGNVSGALHAECGRPRGPASARRAQPALSRPADDRRRRTASRPCRRCRRGCRDRSARARSSSDRASRARCRVPRPPC